MSPGESNLLHVIHVLSVVGMVSAAVVATLAPAEARKKTLMWGGISSLVAILTGIRLWQGMYQFSGHWVWGKIVCWLALSALVGPAFRARGAAGALRVTALAVAAVALYLVYFKPF